MHSNSFYNQHQQQQRHGANTVPSILHVSAPQGPDVDPCRQSAGHSGSSSTSSSSSSSQLPALQGLVPGPRTNPHSYAKEYYSGASALTRYQAPSTDCTGTGALPPSATAATGSTGLRPDDTNTVRPPCRQADTGPTSNTFSAGSSCQYSGTQQQFGGNSGASARPTPCGNPVQQSSQSVDWSSELPGSSSHQQQSRINLSGYTEAQQQQSQGAVWMAGCVNYRPQVTSATHR
jgi:hypothetical protein